MGCARRAASSRNQITPWPASGETVPGLGLSRAGESLSQLNFGNLNKLHFAM
jgi:hypothetical protein